MPSQLQALILDNGIEGLASQFRSDDRIHYDFAKVGPGFQLDLTGKDVFIAPNGTDHIALYRNREVIQGFLHNGGKVLCFDGWFTDWIPGHRWIMDNTKKTIDTRYRLRDKVADIGNQFNVSALNFSNGISGWWACGYIEPHPKAKVLLEDTWSRPLVVIDTESTPGTIILTASGPLGDGSYATTDDDGPNRAMADLYRALIDYISLPQPISTP